MKVAILGAGSIGCYAGGAWRAAGVDVTFIGRERIADEIARNGLKLSDQDGWSETLPANRISFSTSPAALGDADVIALTVKSTGTEAAARDIAAHGRPGATVLSLQNGVSNADTLERMLPAFRVARGMATYNVVHLAPGHWHRATWGDLAAARTPMTEALAAAIGDRPGRLVIRDDIVEALWGKLLLNLNNAVNALSGMTILDELRQRDYRRVLAAAMREGLALLDAAGIQPARIAAVSPRMMPRVIASPDWLFERLFLKLQKIDPKGRSSMADDLAAGRPTEIDYLQGELVRLAEKLGRTAPVNAAIVALVRDAERGEKPQWSPAELRRAVLER